MRFSGPHTATRCVGRWRIPAAAAVLRPQLGNTRLLSFGLGMPASVTAALRRILST